MQVAEDMGAIRLAHDPRGRVSLDQVVERLVAMRDAHHRRARKQKERRRRHVPILPAPLVEDVGAQCGTLVEGEGAGLG